MVNAKTPMPTPAPLTLWFRNPKTYVRELVETGQSNIVWDKGLLVKSRINAVVHAKLHFRATGNWRVLIISDDGSPEYNSKQKEPVGVYPEWLYGEPFASLEHLVQNPVGLDEDACQGDSKLPFVPIYKQEHKVIILGLPALNTGMGRKFMRELSDLQDDYPECTLHIHALYSFPFLFGMNWKSVDFEPRTDAAKGTIYLPNGKPLRKDKFSNAQQWIHMLGYSVPELAVPRNRCMYNIKSAAWAAEKYKTESKFNSAQRNMLDPTQPRYSKKVFSTAVVAKPGDKYHCDTCSLNLTCKYSRAGAVCSIPDSETSGLARMFGSRDSERIIDGLGRLMEVSVTRLSDARLDEELTGELNPEVTKMINSTFSNGVKLAKLINPNLQGGTKVGVFVNGQPASAQVTSGSPQQLMSGIIREFENKGIPRDKITPKMIEGALTAMGGEDKKPTRIIEAISATETVDD